MPTRAEISQWIQTAKQTSQDDIRRKLMSSLHELTGNDTILYASSFSSQKRVDIPSTHNSIVLHDIQGLMAALHGLSGKRLDLILHSPGGSLEAAEQIVSYLRAKYEFIRAIVPQNAMSAATMIACACDEIMMGKHSALGPIDPQITVPTTAGYFTAPAQAILDEFELATSSVTNDPRTSPLWVTRMAAYPPGVLAMCKDNIQRSKDRVSEWLNLYMFRCSDGPGDEIADWLGNAKLHKSHSRPIGIEQARSAGLPITAIEDHQDFQERILSVFHATSVTFDVTNCVKMIENHLGKGTFTFYASTG